MIGNTHDIVTRFHDAEVTCHHDKMLGKILRSWRNSSAATCWILSPVPPSGATKLCGLAPQKGSQPTKTRENRAHRVKFEASTTQSHSTNARQGAACARLACCLLLNSLSLRLYDVRMIIACNACSLAYVITADAVAAVALAVAVANTMFAANEYNNQNKRNSCSPVLC